MKTSGNWKQVKVHNKYTAADFDEDLRQLLRRAGCKDEKLCFMLDESNVLESGFLERMNTLLANGEVPGLFEGDEYTTLMTQCKEGAQREGLMLDSAEELYKWFTQQVPTAPTTTSSLSLSYRVLPSFTKFFTRGFLQVTMLLGLVHVLDGLSCIDGFSNHFN